MQAELIAGCEALIKATWNNDAIRNSEAMTLARTAVRRAKGLETARVEPSKDD